MSQPTCHNCGASMERLADSLPFACTGCDFIWDGCGPQRVYGTGRPCPCDSCAPRALARPRLIVVEPGPSPTALLLALLSGRRN